MSLYDPNDLSYLDPIAARAERDRTFQVCSDCRVCVRLCPSFKSLFQMIDAYEDGAHDVRVLNDKEHDRVVDECYQCKLCYVICPYTPERQQEWVIDFPRLMLRSLAVHHVQAKVSPSARLLARTDLQGKLATTLAPVVNRMNNVGIARGVMEKVTGIAKDRLLPTFASVRFSKWFRDRQATPPAEPARLSRSSPPASSSTRTRRSARPWSVSTSATASRASCPTVRCAAGCRGSTPATSTSSTSTPSTTSRCSRHAFAKATTSSCRSRRARTC